MARNKYKKQLLKEHPYCIYCGGEALATTVDHMPPIGMFPNRDRPKGMEFPACETCNRDSRKLDDLAAFFASIGDGTQVNGDTKHFEKLLKSLWNNYPAVAFSLRPSRVQLQQVHGVTNQNGEQVGALNVDSPQILGPMKRFGAKCGMALHWQKTGKALPRDGYIAVDFNTNEIELKEDPPLQLVRLLGPGVHLEQGKKTSFGVFQYASAQSTDGPSTAHWVLCGNTILYNIFCVTEYRDALDVIPDSDVFRPGCLISAR